MHLQLRQLLGLLMIEYFGMPQAFLERRRRRPQIHAAPLPGNRAGHEYLHGLLADVYPLKLTRRDSAELCRHSDLRQTVLGGARRQLLLKLGVQGMVGMTDRNGAERHSLRSGYIVALQWWT